MRGYFFSFLANSDRRLMRHSLVSFDRNGRFTVKFDQNLKINPNLRRRHAQCPHTTDYAPR